MELFEFVFFTIWGCAFTRYLQNISDELVIVQRAITALNHVVVEQQGLTRKSLSAPTNDCNIKTITTNKHAHFRKCSD